MSTQSVEARVAAIKSMFGWCFGCGLHNPVGLQLGGFVTAADTVSCRWSPRAEYQSFPDVIHGGIVTAALDEVMAWTAMLLVDHTVVTGTMDLRFRRPAMHGETFDLAARLDDHRGRRVMLSASMTDIGGNEIASAHGMFITMDRLELAGSAE